jgi:hypothetical protein
MPDGPARQSHTGMAAGPAPAQPERFDSLVVGLAPVPVHCVLGSCSVRLGEVLSGSGPLGFWSNLGPSSVSLFGAL